MKTKNILIGLTAGLVLTVAIISWMGLSRPSSLEANINTAQESHSEKNVSLIIDDGQGKLENFDFPAEEGATAFDFLKKMAEKSKVALRTKNYEFGLLIESIGSKVNGQEGKYWMYYVNGEMSNVSADKKEIKPGDKIEFKFEKSPF